MDLTQEDIRNTEELTVNLIEDIESERYRNYVYLTSYMMAIQYILSKHVLSGDRTIDETRDMLERQTKYIMDGIIEDVNKKV